MQDNNSDELTLKELILKLQEYFWEIVRSWWIVLLFCLVTSAFFLKQHYDHLVTHQAKLLFMIEGQGGGGGGALASILGGMGGGSSGGTNPFKVMEVAYGSELFIKLLNTKGEDGEMISNKILKDHELVEEWEEVSNRFKDFKFNKFSPDITGDRLQNTGFRKLQRIIWGSGSNRSDAITSLKLDKDTGIFELSTNARSEKLSLLITNTVYRELKFFFEEELFRNQQQIANILNVKADSLQYVRDAKIRELARFEDRNRAIIGKSVIAQRTILTMEQNAINQAYTVVLQKKEMTDVTNRDRKPLFVAIDKPYSPLPVRGSNLIKALIMAIAVGGFISILFILIRKIYRDVMAS